MEDLEEKILSNMKDLGEKDNDAFNNTMNTKEPDIEKEGTLGH